MAVWGVLCHRPGLLRWAFPVQPVPSMTDPLFSPLPLGAATLQHRVVMAPLTRMRAGEGHVPTALNAQYYAQRASPGGLLIAEATPVSWQGHGHPRVPGIHTAAQVAGWRQVMRLAA